VRKRSRVGDWEGDTVIGKNQKGALVTLVERKPLYTIIEGIARKGGQLQRFVELL
jgi:transposase, IS30 family